MPRSQTYYTPDAVDCNTCCTAIRQDFGLNVIITTEYVRDEVQVICKALALAGEYAGVVQVQSLVRAPLKSRRDLYAMQYSAILDCWHQLDRGVLGVAQTPIERSWDGRPRQPAKHAS